MLNMAEPVVEKNILPRCWNLRLCFKNRKIRILYSQPIKSKTAHSLIISLILTVGYLSHIHAVTDIDGQVGSDILQSNNDRAVFLEGFVLD